MARRPPARPALVAAASRPLVDRSATVPKPKDWQAEAWTMFDEVGEIKYATSIAGNAMAKLRLFVAVRPGDDPTAAPIPAADAEETEAVPEDVAAAAEADLHRLLDAAGGAPELLRSVNVNLEVAGELWLVGWAERAAGEEHGPAPERWEVRSVSEVRWVGSGSERRAEVGPPGASGRAREVVAGRDAIIRIWVRHPRFADEADSNLRGVLGDCRSLLALQQQAIAETRSLIGAGAVTVPNELTITTPSRALAAGDAEPEDDPDRDPFMVRLEDALLDAVEDPSSPASVAPLVIRGPAEFLQPQYLRHFTFGRGGDDVLERKIEARVRRLARGMNLPVEVVLGHQQTTFANAEQVDEDTFEDHYEPRARLLVDTLTAAYLRPGLLDAGHDADVVSRLFVWYDASALLSNPSTEENADGAFDRGAISWDAYRRVKGFDAGDAPEPLELLQRAGLLRGILTAELTAQLLNLLGGPKLEPPPEPGGANVGPPGGDAAAALAAVLAALAGSSAPDGAGRGRHPFPAALEAAASRAPSRRPDPPGRVLMDLDRSLRTRLQAAVDAALDRAVERAGNRVRSKAGQAGREVLRLTPPAECYATLGPSLLAAAGIADDDLLADAWQSLERQFKTWTKRAGKDALDLAGSLTSGFTPAARSTYLLRQAKDVDEAWSWLRGSLDQVAKLTLADPSWKDAVAIGEFDPTAKAPTGLLRQALRMAGGAGGAPVAEVSTSGLGSAWVTVYDGLPPGGVATGPLIHEVLRDGGAHVEGYRWVYGPADRSRPFLPHLRLDGLVFVDFTDERLVIGGSFPTTGHYIPGDHRGCICDVEPIVLSADEVQALRDAGRLPGLAAEAVDDDGAPDYVQTARTAEAEADRLRRPLLDGTSPIVSTEDRRAWHDAQQRYYKAREARKLAEGRWEDDLAVPGEKQPKALVTARRALAKKESALERLHDELTVDKRRWEWGRAVPIGADDAERARRAHAYQQATKDISDYDGKVRRLQKQVADLEIRVAIERAAFLPASNVAEAHLAKVREDFGLAEGEHARFEDLVRRHGPGYLNLHQAAGGMSASDAAWLRQHLDMIGEVPDEWHDAMAANGMKWSVNASPDYTDPALLGRRVGQGHGEARISAYFSPNDKQVVLVNHPGGSAHVAIHEAGHAIDWIKGGGSGGGWWSANDKRWRVTWDGIVADHERLRADIIREARERPVGERGSRFLPGRIDGYYRVDDNWSMHSQRWIGYLEAFAEAQAAVHTNDWTVLIPGRGEEVERLRDRLRKLVERERFKGIGAATVRP